MRAIPFHSSRENVMWLNMWHLIDRNATSVDSSSLGNSEKKCEKISLNFPSSTAPHRLTTEHEPFLYRQIMDEYFHYTGFETLLRFLGWLRMLLDTSDSTWLQIYSIIDNTTASAACACTNKRHIAAVTSTLRIQSSYWAMGRWVRGECRL